VVGRCNMKTRYPRFRGPPSAAFAQRFRAPTRQPLPNTRDMPTSQCAVLWQGLVLDRRIMWPSVYTLRDRYICGLFHLVDSVQRAHVRWWHPAAAGEGVVPWI